MIIMEISGFSAETNTLILFLKVPLEEKDFLIHTIRGLNEFMDISYKNRKSIDKTGNEIKFFMLPNEIVEVKYRKEAGNKVEIVKKYYKWTNSVFEELTYDEVIELYRRIS